MPRKRQVQRTIKCTTVTLTAFNKDNHTVDEINTTVSGTYPHDDMGKARLEKAVEKTLSSVYKLLEVTEWVTTVQHYTMPEEQYLMYATVTVS